MLPSLFSIILFLRIFNVSFGWELWESTKDYMFGETCKDRWLSSDIAGFQSDLKLKVIGQPFLDRALIPLLKQHLSRSSAPKKALALSFHGGPGVGKTYVSQLIAARIYKEGPKSKFYKFFSMSEAWLITEDNIRKIIKDTVIECERAMFVFDEVEKMPDGIIEVIKSFLDFHPLVGQVDYRKSMFIFISNIGMEQINELSFSLWKQGINRKNYNVADFEKALFQPAFNEKGGLKKTSIVKNYLIDLYLPFLPLEKEHVRECIKFEAKNMNYGLNDNSFKNILDSLSFLPPGEEIYSYSGCKSIVSLVFRYGNSHDEL